MFGEHILVMDTAVARQCTSLYVPDPRSDQDSLIASTAVVRKMTLITRNVEVFALTDVFSISLDASF